MATDVGGIPELLFEKENGSLVPPRDADSLAETIERALAKKQTLSISAGMGWRESAGMLLEEFKKAAANN